MAVFEGSKSNGESDSRAYAKAWGVLNKNQKLEDSHETKNPDETKKQVKKWEKKHKWKNKKKKKKKSSSVLYELKKLAQAFEIINMPEEAADISEISKKMKDVFHGSNLDKCTCEPGKCDCKPCKTPNSTFHIFVEDNEVGARVSLPFSLELEEEEYQELEDDIHDALEEILSKYFEEDEDVKKQTEEKKSSD